MTFAGKSSLYRILVGVFLLAPAATTSVLARDYAAEGSPRDAAVQEGRPASVAALAAQVGEIARSKSLSRAKKEKRISTAVRIAVVAATSYKSDRAEILGIALSYAGAAASAAPHFAEVIANAVLFAPPVKQIDAAPGQVRTAAFAAAKNPHAATRVASHTPAARKKRPEAVAAIEYPPPAPQPEPAPEAEAVAPAPATLPADLPANPPVAESPGAETEAAKVSLGSNTTVTFTAEAGARHDDNVFLSTTDKVGDTIFSLTPGVDFRFGNASLAHGSLAYKETFLQYANKSADNQALGTGAANFDYNDGGLAVAGSALYQQLYQNNRDVAAIGGKTIFRSNVLDIMTSAESHVTAKTSVKGGLDFNSLQYENAGLVGSRNFSVPLKVYYETTPKVALSTGFTYQHIQQQNGGSSGRDLFYNVGARGNFTEKLSGEISTGLHRREMSSQPRQKLWGFDGSLNYDISPKTTSSLVFSRQFTTGAKGETLQDSSYAFKVSNDPSLQWQLSAGATYRDVQYEPVLVLAGGLPVSLDRQDRYWEGNFNATFLFSSSLSLSAGYTYRRNLSNLPGAEFGNNILSLMLDWRR